MTIDFESDATDEEFFREILGLDASALAQAVVEARRIYRLAKERTDLVDETSRAREEIGRVLDKREATLRASEELLHERHALARKHEEVVERRVLQLKPLLVKALRLVTPFEWADDRGRECQCPWCGATRWTFEKDANPRDNHREACEWRGFFDAATAIVGKEEGK